VDALSLHQSALAAGLPDTMRSLTRFTNYITSSRQARVSKVGDKDSSSLTLEQCLAEHTREEQLDEDNAWYCSVCKKHQPAKKVVSFWKERLPEVLILTLKRFEFRDVSNLVGRRGISHREKIDTFIDFPLHGLDLKPYCAYAGSSISESAASEDISVDAESNDDRTLYDLFAVCNHYGRLGFGHYTAFARDWRGDNLSQNWYSFDDNDVSLIQDGDVKSRAAYILFYRRRPSTKS
jgi:ubiquitin carboxyl-terminal hydrolase 4/11/15